MLGGRELTHVRACLCDNDVRSTGADSRNGADQVAEATKLLHHRLKPLCQLVDHRSVLIDEVEVNSGEERVMVVEATDHGLGQLWDLVSQSLLCQISHLRSVALPGNQCLDHRSPRVKSDAVVYE